jgi:hypothetical protein
MSSEPCRQNNRPRTGILRAAHRGLAARPPVGSKKKVLSAVCSKLGANRHREAPTGSWPTDSYRACGDFVTGLALLTTVLENDVALISIIHYQ